VSKLIFFFAWFVFQFHSLMLCFFCFFIYCFQFNPQYFYYFFSILFFILIGFHELSQFIFIGLLRFQISITIFGWYPIFFSQYHPQMLCFYWFFFLKFYHSIFGWFLIDLHDLFQFFYRVIVVSNKHHDNRLILNFASIYFLSYN
jgi:hypothetical protein